MAEFCGTPHNSAKAGDIAKTVLMPGDPKRAEYIANTYLENARQFNDVRGMSGFTGTYKGREVSVMAHGMGIPSAAIYSYELFAFYGVENIIRIGSATSPLPHIKGVAAANKSFSTSSFAKMAFSYDENCMPASESLTDSLISTAGALGKAVTVGPVFSGDVFYYGQQVSADAFPPEVISQVIAFEMESFGIFANARYLGKNAACLVNVAGDGDGKATMEDMIAIALETAAAL